MYFLERRSVTWEGVVRSRARDVMLLVGALDGMGGEVMSVRVS